MKAKRTSKLKRAAVNGRKPVHSHRVVGEPTAIFGGKSSVGMWNHINEAKTVDDLRMALYGVTCRCQELESEVRRLYNNADEARRGKEI